MSVQAHSGGKMRCVSVRFGNTLGAFGGIVSRMKAQIDQGGPVKIHNTDLRQSFISVKAAVNGILQAASNGWAKKEDAYALFTLEVGWPIQIRNLAEMLIRLRGYKPGKDIVIELPEGQPQAEKAQGCTEIDPAAYMAEEKRNGIVLESFEAVDVVHFHADLERLRLSLSDRREEDIYSLLRDIAGDIRAERSLSPSIQ
jgi:nucleoside-diphosphate-sugar epimerase